MQCETENSADLILRDRDCLWLKYIKGGEWDNCYLNLMTNHTRLQLHNDGSRLNINKRDGTTSTDRESGPAKGK